MTRDEFAALLDDSMDEYALPGIANGRLADLVGPEETVLGAAGFVSGDRSRVLILVPSALIEATIEWTPPDKSSIDAVRVPSRRVAAVVCQVTNPHEARGSSPGSPETAERVVKRTTLTVMVEGREPVSFDGDEWWTLWRATSRSREVVTAALDLVRNIGSLAT